MNISYRFASAQGDVVVDRNMMERPFAVGPAEYHDFMTLGDFFDSVRRFLLIEYEPTLADILGRILQRPVRSDEIGEVVIRYEKYGTLYQICSIEVSVGEDSAMMCTSVAFSEPARQTLEQEYRLLALLGKKEKIDCLPRVYRKERIEVERAGRKEELFMVLLEWFEGYEEWHFQRHADSTRAFVWDMRGGYRFLSEAQTFDTMRQASRILTLCYDVQSTHRIAPWHHGAGDFIVKASVGSIDTKLITVRGYNAMRRAGDDGDVLRTLCAFCMETLTKMRLDKWEGMGESTWADSFVLDAALMGFYEALKEKESLAETQGLTSPAVLKSLKSYGPEEVRSLVVGILDGIREYDLSDYGVVLGHLDRHVLDIRTALQSFTG